MRIEVESFDAELALVRFRCPAGTVEGRWIGDRDPDIGEKSDVEFRTDPRCVWGTDVTDASPGEPDSIRQDANGFEFVGQVQLPILPEDLRDGVFTLRVAGSLHILEADGLPADVGGRRVRVRQQSLEVYPIGA